MIHSIEKETNKYWQGEKNDEEKRRNLIKVEMSRKKETNKQRNKQTIKETNKQRKGEEICKIKNERIEINERTENEKKNEGIKRKKKTE